MIFLINIKLLDIIKKEERSLNWVATKTGISYSTLHKLSNNDTKSISFEVLEKLCTLFNVDVCDMIEIKKDEK